MRAHDENKHPSSLAVFGYPPPACHPSVGNIFLKNDYRCARPTQATLADRDGLTDHSNGLLHRIAGDFDVNKLEQCAVASPIKDVSGRAAIPVMRKSAMISMAQFKNDRRIAPAMNERHVRAKKATTTTLAVRGKRGVVKKMAGKAGGTKNVPLTKPDDRPYECLIKKPWGCGAIFERDSDRQRHMDTHFAVHGDADADKGGKILGVTFGFVCRGCNFRFARADALKRHAEHAGQKCLPSAHDKDGVEHAWKTKEGCQHLRLPPSSDPLRNQIRDLWQTYGRFAELDK